MLLFFLSHNSGPFLRLPPPPPSLPLPLWQRAPLGPAAQRPPVSSLRHPGLPQPVLLRPQGGLRRRAGVGRVRHGGPEEAGPVQEQDSEAAKGGAGGRRRRGSGVGGAGPEREWHFASGRRVRSELTTKYCSIWRRETYFPNSTRDRNKVFE